MIRVKTNWESLAYIHQHGSSVARFGDGEFDIMAGHSIPYQDYHPSLAQALREIVCQSSTPNFLVCLPDVFEKLERYNTFCQDFWQQHLSHYQALYQELCQAEWYGSTFLSRPYIDLEDKSLAAPIFASLKDLWEDKDVLIVEGVTSRSGVGNDLFANVRSLERVICPSKNAYQVYDWIADQIRQFGRDKLVLLMLGPTAKVLSYNLSQEGFWTIDLGHIDSEYEWFKMGAISKVKLGHKHTAEHNFDEGIVLEEDQLYEAQIVARYDQKVSQETISVAFCLNDAYINHLRTVIYSLVKHNKEKRFDIYIVHRSLNQESLGILDEINQVFDTVTMIPSQIDPDLLALIDTQDSRWPLETYFEFFVPTIVKPGVSKVLYLDVDVLVVGDISELWATDLTGKYLAGAREPLVYHYPERFTTIGITPEDDYINAGVLLLNCDLWKKEDITSQICQFAVEKAEQFKYLDQDVLNAFFCGKMALFDPKFNYCHDFMLNTPDFVQSSQAVIYHFSGSAVTKPWRNLALTYDYLTDAAYLYRQYRNEYFQFIETSSPKISVLMPVKNASPYLLEALDSIGNQTFVAIEVIIVDDHSTDDSLERCQDYAKYDRRFKICSAEKEGLGFALTQAVSMARGDLVTVVYPHHFLSETYLQTLYRSHVDQDAAIVVGNHFTYSEQDQIFYYNMMAEESLLTPHQAKERMTNPAYCQLSNKLYRKTLLTDFGQLTLNEDEIVRWLYEKTDKVAVSTAHLYGRRSTLLPQASLDMTLADADKALVSVIVPVYNVEDFLEECLESITTQTYHHLEILLINDGSTDRSLAICHDWAAKDNRIRVIDKANGGASDARNVGLKEAKGDFILFIDSDDLVMPDLVDVLYKQQFLHQADIVIGNYMNFYQDSGVSSYYVLDRHFCIEEVPAIEAVVRQSAWHLNTSVFMLSVAKLFRKSLFENIVYPVGRMFEDEVITHKLLLKSRKTILVNGNYYIYRIRENSVMTSQFNVKRAYDLLDMINEKLADIALYGGDLYDAKNRAYKLLADYQRHLEHHELTDDPVYQMILSKMSLYREGIPEKKDE